LGCDLFESIELGIKYNCRMRRLGGESVRKIFYGKTITADGRKRNDKEKKQPFQGLFLSSLILYPFIPAVFVPFSLHRSEFNGESLRIIGKSHNKPWLRNPFPLRRIVQI
jgi:hypothetical protein